jgi:hypothetical protein
MSSSLVSSSEKSESTSAPPPKRRSYWQMLNLSGRNRAFWGKLIILGLFLMPIVAGFACQMLWQVMSEISHLHFDDPTMADHLVGELRSVGFLFLSVIILLCLLSVYFVFFLSVRVFGPQVALLRFIEQIKSGNYTPYRKLRKEDQLKEIWQGLQDLAAELKRRSS